MAKYTYYTKSIFKIIHGFKNWPSVFLLLAGLKKGGVVKLRESGLKFQIRTPLDAWSVKEVFLDRFYEKYGCETKDNWTVIDIGGGIGDTPVSAAFNKKNTHVHVFEPNKQSCELIRANAELNGIKNISIHNQAVWKHNGKIILENATSGEAGQFVSRADKSADSGGAEVDCITLGAIFEQKGIAACDLMKIDCEGAEYPIMFNTDDATLLKIKRIVMEYHDSICEYTHHHMCDFLVSKGYRVSTHDNFAHKDIGYLYAERA